MPLRVSPTPPITPPAIAPTGVDDPAPLASLLPGAGDLQAAAGARQGVHTMCTHECQQSRTGISCPFQCPCPALQPPGTHGCPSGWHEIWPSAQLVACESQTAGCSSAGTAASHRLGLPSSASAFRAVKLPVTFQLAGMEPDKRLPSSNLQDNRVCWYKAGHSGPGWTVLLRDKTRPELPSALLGCAENSTATLPTPKRLGAASSRTHSVSSCWNASGEPHSAGSVPLSRLLFK